MFIYMDLYVWASLWIHGWVAKEVIFGIFDQHQEYLEGTALSILVQRPHKELCCQKPVRSQEKDEGRLVCQEWDSEVESDIQSSVCVGQTIHAQDVGLVSRL